MKTLKLFLLLATLAFSSSKIDAGTASYSPSGDSQPSSTVSGDDDDAAVTAADARTAQETNAAIADLQAIDLSSLAPADQQQVRDTIALLQELLEEGTPSEGGSRRKRQTGSKCAILKAQIEAVMSKVSGFVGAVDNIGTKISKLVPKINIFETIIGRTLNQLTGNRLRAAADKLKSVYQSYVGQLNIRNVAISTLKSTLNSLKVKFLTTFCNIFSIKWF
jgi:hypothetical protein